ncbi:four helix bundle protein [Aestuariivivens insulae]|uniref:four helix bundle protein n=1 Tax=Aestuariivivens insulae TaxID=1621988 RepID=UPI001F58318D|nr:four helix bundle protein [Aestuariivivens insulae]
MKLFSFEKLVVWQEARHLALFIYKTTKSFPSEEKFGLVSQMRRSAVSISSNIVEGSGRHSNKDKARFTEIAYGSALELLNQAILSNDLEFVTTIDYEIIRDKIGKITAMLDGLYKSQLKN